ncbi:hypothetical protein BJ138DRAFT_1140985 [Hygrophoropsis aurantiaca]|uniref:Uncharacterized protein n=1 Tax=Hygrophoropsis aurantiaca TaxID=72124 RepID=A0ACB8AR71_9AGAM|nr:hypothetical protein BJ138DRAFT_1140985 [Hygrophoropsis aurantiaca]
MKMPDTSRKYTTEEKQQLLRNLDIEVEHRVQRLEAWLADALENFQMHQDGLISRIPKPVRGVSMGEFADKYNGDVQACLRGLQRERLPPETLEIDKDTRKRKWAASQEEMEASGANAGTAQDAESSRATKTARVMAATPKKKAGTSTGPGTAQHARLFSINKTPGTSRTMGRIPSIAASPSPNKYTKPSTFSRAPARPASPSKTIQQSRTTRPPSTATFNPAIPKTPAYPTMRAPRRDESMLSVNGSPLANPYQLGLGWFAGTTDDEIESDGPPENKGKGKQADAPKTIRKMNSIVIRRDPSVAFSSSSSSNGQHSRSNSQHNLAPPRQTHSRSNSQSRIQMNAHPESTLKPAPSQLVLPTPSVQGYASALVAIPTKDGHVLEFDPLQTSPRALDALVGITDSAKKQAKEEMGRLVQAAVSKWSIA